MTYLQAIVIGLLQGVTELFPVSSLGHSVLIPALLGWDNLAQNQSADESFYLAFLVGLHVATAIALIIAFRRDWVRIVSGLVSSLRQRRIDTPDERRGWLLILATVPVGFVGLVFEHQLRVVFAKPLAAAVFLMINGVILLLGERLRRRANQMPEATDHAGDPAATAGPGSSAATTTRTTPERQGLAGLAVADALVIGSSEILALFAGISRSGVTMVAGLRRGLDHEDAARFSFLLATPVILAAGLYKLPDLAGPLGDGLRGQILAGSLAAGAAAYLSARLLVRWFTTRTLTPFGIYCLIAGALCVLRFH